MKMYGYERLIGKTIVDVDLVFVDGENGELGEKLVLHLYGEDNPFEVATAVVPGAPKLRSEFVITEWPEEGFDLDDEESDD